MRLFLTLTALLVFCVGPQAHATTTKDSPPPTSSSRQLALSLLPATPKTVYLIFLSSSRWDRQEGGFDLCPAESLQAASDLAESSLARTWPTYAGWSRGPTAVMPVSNEMLQDVVDNRLYLYAYAASAQRGDDTEFRIELVPSPIPLTDDQAKLLFAQKYWPRDQGWSEASIALSQLFDSREVAELYELASLSSR